MAACTVYSTGERYATEPMDEADDVPDRIPVLLMGLAAMPAEAQVQRVIFASAGFDETNRFWGISRPN